MFGLTAGEWFVVIFILVAVVSAPLWPRAGEAILVRLSRRSGANTGTGKDESKARGGEPQGG
jgi:hypothetical protein